MLEFDPNLYASYFDDDITEDVDQDDDGEGIDGGEFTWEKEIEDDAPTKKESFEAQKRAVLFLIDICRVCPIVAGDYLTKTISTIREVALEMMLFGQEDFFGVSFVNTESYGSQPIVPLIEFGILNHLSIQKLLQFERLSISEQWASLGNNMTLADAIACDCCQFYDAEHIRVAFFQAGQTFQELGKARRSSRRLMILTPCAYVDSNNLNASSLIEEVSAIITTLKDMGVTTHCVPITVSHMTYMDVLMEAPSHVTRHDPQNREHYTLWDSTFWSTLLGSSALDHRLDAIQALKLIAAALSLNRCKLLFHAWLSVGDCHIPVSAAPLVSISTRLPTPFNLDFESKKLVNGTSIYTDERTGAVIPSSELSSAIELPGFGHPTSLRFRFRSQCRSKLRAMSAPSVPVEYFNTKRKMPPPHNRILVLGRVPVEDAFGLPNIGTSLALGPVEYMMGGSSRFLVSLLDELKASEQALFTILLRSRSAPSLALLHPPPGNQDGLAMTPIPWANEYRNFDNPVSSDKCAFPEPSRFPSIIEAWDRVLSEDVHQGEYDPDGLSFMIRDPARLRFKNLIECLAGVSHRTLKDLGNDDDPNNIVSMGFPASSELHRIALGMQEKRAPSKAASGSPKKKSSSRMGSNLDVEELTSLCDEVEATYDAGKLNSINVPRLRKYCMAKGIDPKGLKSEIVEKIVHFLATIHPQ